MINARCNLASGILIFKPIVRNCNLFFLFLISFILVFTGCEEQSEESPIVVFIQPNQTSIEANANQRVLLTVNATTNVGSTLNMKVESIDDEFGVVQHFDSTFKQPVINYTLDYIIPQYPDSTESILKFTFTNSAQNTIQIARRLLINKGASLVTESSGHTIYSSESSKPNSFSLEAVSPGYLEDSLTISPDIVDNTKAKVDGENLSRNWVSYTNLTFVEFNGFNYASANSLTIKNAYESGVKLSRVSGIQSGDVFIVGKGNTAIGAIQIVAVVDQPSTEEDSYNFNLKLIDK